MNPDEGWGIQMTRSGISRCREYNMTRISNQKTKILYLMRLFEEESDEEHPLTRKKIEEKMGNLGIRMERKTLYNDIETLKNFGLDISYRKAPPEGYFLAHRDFELAELKLLVDAVQSSRFITEKKSDSLIRKIERLASRFEAGQLQRQVVVSDRIKAMNESIYYNVDKLHTAISTNRQISFHYFEWTVLKEMRLKKNGGVYRVSPWALTWDNENYYLIGCDTDVKAIKHFRVDKMLDIEVLECPREGREEFGKFDLARYTKRTFGMFGGKTEIVRIRFHNRFVGVVIDRFGKDAALHPDGEEHFIARVEVAVSEQFYGWLTGLGRDVELLSPERVIKEYHSLLDDLAEKYKEK